MSWAHDSQTEKEPKEGAAKFGFVVSQKFLNMRMFALSVSFNGPAVLHRFGQMRYFNFGFAIQVGKGSGDLQNTVRASTAPSKM
jgi:hypothetical protein